MRVPEETIEQLARIPDVSVSREEPLSNHARFGIGGPADVYVEARSKESFTRALNAARLSGAPYTVIGEGSNLIVSDDGFRGIVLRFTADAIEVEGELVRASAGANLQNLVDLCIDYG